MQVQQMHPRVLSDLSQRQVRAQHLGSRVYLQRGEEFEIAPNNSFPNEIRFLGPEEALDSVSCVAPARGRVRGARPPARFYKPQDMGVSFPQFVVIDRSTDQAQARVRGTLEYVEREVRKLAAAHGMKISDFKIVLEG